MRQQAHAPTEGRSCGIRATWATPKSLAGLPWAVLVLVSFLVLTSPPPARAADNDPQQIFNDAKALGKARNSDLAGTINNDTAKQNLPTYKGQTSTPETEAYAQNPTAATAALRAKCTANPNDATCAGVNSGTQNRQKVYIRLDDKALAGRTAVTNPQAILGDFSTTYNACTTTTPEVQSAAQFAEKTCSLDFTNTSTASCQKSFNILGSDRYSCTPGTWFSATTVFRNGADKMEIQALCEPTRLDGRRTYRVWAYGGKGACMGWQQFEVDMNTPTSDPWAHKVADLSPHWGGGCKGVQVYEYGPGCQGGTCTKSFHFVWPGREEHWGTLSFEEPHMTQKAQEMTINECEPYEKMVPAGALPPDGDNTAHTSYSLPLNALNMPHQCARTNSVCLEGPETRVFDGKAVYKSCWRYQNTFSCSDLATSSTCSASDATQCNQVNPSVCSVAGPGGSCSSVSFPLQCPTAEAKYNAAVNCGPSTFCSGGSCYDSTNQASQPPTQFVTSVSQLAAAAEASEDLDTATMTIFKGKALKCKNYVLGFVDCCDSRTILDSVGGGGTLLLACKSDWDQVMELSQKREQGLCHWNWKWTSKKGPLGITIEESESYCCFNSKLGRIINEQGRAQIGKGWGSKSNPDNPDCTGFTVEQLQSLDFSQIDFSDFYADIKPVIPSTDSLIDKAGSSAPECYYGAGKCQQ